VLSKVKVMAFMLLQKISISNNPEKMHYGFHKKY